MKAVIYARVSSREQEKGGYSIPAQLKLLREYANKKGVVVVHEFTDVETAKSAGRTEFSRMVGFLRSNSDARIILVEKTDRLYRNFKDYVLLEDLEITIHLVKENEVISKESRSHAKLIHGIKVVLAKNYIDNLSEEVKKGQREKAEQGGWPSKAPPGYINNKNTHQVEIDPEKAPLVTRAFRLYSTGDYSLDKLRQKLALEGLTTGVRKPISKGRIEAILKSPFYYGEFVWNGHRCVGIHEPIITRELYNQVQQTLRRKDKPKNKRNFAFTGLLQCGKCGCMITAEIKKGRYTYYHCTSGRGKCNQPYIREEKLDTLLSEVVASVRIDRNVAEWVVEALKDSAAEEQEYRKREENRLKRRLDMLQSRLDKAYLDKIDGVIDEGYWIDLSKRWREEQDEAADQLRRHRQADRNYVDQASRILELAQNAYSLYLQQSLPEKRELLQTLLSNCTLNDLTIYPTYRKPFDMLAEGCSLQTKLGDRDSNPE